MWRIEFGKTTVKPGAFTVLDFDNPDDSALVYIEKHLGSRYLEQPQQVSEYRRIFKLLHDRTIPIEEYGQ